MTKCMHFQSIPDIRDEPGYIDCKKGHDWCEHTSHPTYKEFTDLPGRIPCTCKNGKTVNSWSGKIQICYFCKGTSILRVSCWCRVCEEVYLQRYLDDEDFPHHRCDDTCPDYQPDERSEFEREDRLQSDLDRAIDLIMTPRSPNHERRKT